MAAKTKPDQPPVDEMSFEAALKELEQIVSRLEQGEVDLEDSIAWYERGQALKTHCEKKLKAAESRLEKIVQGGAGATGQGGAGATAHGGGTATGAEPMDLGQA